MTCVIFPVITYCDACASTNWCTLMITASKGGSHANDRGYGAITCPFSKDGPFVVASEFPAPVAPEIEAEKKAKT